MILILWLTYPFHIQHVIVVKENTKLSNISYTIKCNSNNRSNHTFLISWSKDEIETSASNNVPRKFEINIVLLRLTTSLYFKQLKN